MQRLKLRPHCVSDGLAERGVIDDGEINHDLVVDQGGHGFPPETKVLDEHACFGACGPGVSGAGEQGEQFEVRPSIGMVELLVAENPVRCRQMGFCLARQALPCSCKSQHVRLITHHFTRPDGAEDSVLVGRIDSCARP